LEEKLRKLRDPGSSEKPEEVKILKRYRWKTVLWFVVWVVLFVACGRLSGTLVWP
jgi:tryptophan-rich sensory protein